METSDVRRHRAHGASPSPAGMAGFRRRPPAAGTGRYAQPIVRLIRFALAFGVLALLVAPAYDDVPARSDVASVTAAVLAPTTSAALPPVPTPRDHALPALVLLATAAVVVAVGSSRWRRVAVAGEVRQPVSWRANRPSRRGPPLSVA
jgi:energy-converting hydrogenase Eha subunit C